MKRISLLVISLSLLLIPAAAFAQVGSEGEGQTVVSPSTQSVPTSQTVAPASPQGGGSSPSAPQGGGFTPPASTYTPPAQSSGGSGTVTNPLGGINSFCGLIKAILSAVIAIGIPIAVLFIVYAGFKFVMAQGNPAELAKARQNLMYTLIGIGIFLGAWLLALVIANTVNQLGAGSVQGQIISCN